MKSKITLVLLMIFISSRHTYAFFQESSKDSLNTESSNSSKNSIPTDGPNQFYIDFVGTANLQANLSQASDQVQGAAGLGVIFERYFLSKSKKQMELFDEDKILFYALRSEMKLDKKIKRLSKKIEDINELLKTENDSSILVEKKRELKKEKLEFEKQKNKISSQTENKSIKKEHKRFFESLDMEAYINVASSVDSLEAELSGSTVTNTETIR
ncbi:hypothetical protein NYZ99_00160 [Maribacter litopenaei]|uniref:DUF4349 domain-containing protein n=1 Tax=Maribacter litopenaei TaxID=2976127 RepID=A0ABY5Y7W9_9FLAO|nr:hypothetical protein [Maribacter litopenaei]UWX55106.1 hypothetical protein NYZ99_00160 [Maribacter litopenaei]